MGPPQTERGVLRSKKSSKRIEGGGGGLGDLMAPITANKANEIPRFLLNSEGITVQGYGGDPNTDPNIYNPCYEDSKEISLFRP